MTSHQDQRPVKGYPDSLGPDIRPGGAEEFGGPVPPYEGRQTHRSRDDAEAMGPVYGPVDYSRPAPRRVISDIERQGVPSTDTTAASPLGAGVSRGRQGNEQALRMSEERQRRDREEHGISPTKSAHPGSPNMQVGDQGG